MSPPPSSVFHDGFSGLGSLVCDGGDGEVLDQSPALEALPKREVAGKKLERVPHQMDNVFVRTLPRQLLVGPVHHRLLLVFWVWKAELLEVEALVQRAAGGPRHEHVWGGGGGLVLHGHAFARDLGQVVGHKVGSRACRAGDEKRLGAAGWLGGALAARARNFAKQGLEGTVAVEIRRGCTRV